MTFSARKQYQDEDEEEEEEKKKEIRSQRSQLRQNGPRPRSAYRRNPKDQMITLQTDFFNP